MTLKLKIRAYSCRFLRKKKEEEEEEEEDRIQKLWSNTCLLL
jgi:hypothetical protein